jgi:hypothetical protein
VLEFRKTSKVAFTSSAKKKKETEGLRKRGIHMKERVQ